MKQITPNSLAFEWKKYVRSERNENVILTTMHLSQLKHFIACSGDESMELMQFALTQWYGFTLKVTSSVRVPYIPSTPEILFICQHCRILMMFRNETLNSSATPNLQFVLPGKKQVITANSVYKPSIEDINATLALIAEAASKNSNV